MRSKCLLRSSKKATSRQWILSSPNYLRNTAISKSVVWSRDVNKLKIIEIWIGYIKEHTAQSIALYSFPREPFVPLKKSKWKRDKIFPLHRWDKYPSSEICSIPISARSLGLPRLRAAQESLLLWSMSNMNSKTCSAMWHLPRRKPKNLWRIY
jgi:hypothetical protein